MNKLIRRSIALLGVCAVVVAAPASGLAKPPAEAQASAKKTAIFDSKPSPGYRDKIVYVISDHVPTGSNIPQIYRVYHGVVTPVGAQNRTTYYDLTASGSENVGNALARVDPAVTTNGGRY